MRVELVSSDTTSVSDLDDFIQFLFEGLDGYAYLVAKEPKKESSWVQEFFEYPAQVDFLKNTIRQASPNFEVYLAPALYKGTDHARREDVKVSNVVWTEFDGNAPSDWEGFPGPPSYTIQSSAEGHQHVYWKLTEPITDVDRLEEINRSIGYNSGADASAWDATQVLRPPSTFNHKRGKYVTFVGSDETSYEDQVFDSLSPAPPPLETNKWILSEIPDPHDVIMRHAFTEDIVQLLKRDKSQVKDRSASLMQLAYATCQLGLSDVEVFVMLRMADDLWEKFKGRRDRDRRLSDIVTKARHKYPAVEIEETEQHTFAFDYKTFMAVEIELDWCIEGMLMDGGNMLAVGPSGVGKTQISLQWMKHLALGKNYLGYNVPKPKKVGFASLEMAHPELQDFLRTQDRDLNDAERDLLAENFIIIPHGESWPLNLPQGQEMMCRFIEAYELDMLFVDSIGSAVIGNINAQEVVQSYINFNDHIRKKYGLTLWNIHHTRKSAPGQNTKSQDDVYGDQYLVNRASSVYAFLPGKDDTIRVDNWKNRMAKKEDRYFLQRTENLNFTKTTSNVDEQIKNNILDKITKDTDVTVGPFGI